MKPYKKMTIEAMQEINIMYDKGLTCSQIAKITGYSRATVHKYIWKPRKRGTKKNE